MGSFLEHLLFPCCTFVNYTELLPIRGIPLGYRNDSCPFVTDPRGPLENGNDLI